MCRVEGIACARSFPFVSQRTVSRGTHGVHQALGGQHGEVSSSEG